MYINQRVIDQFTRLPVCINYSALLGKMPRKMAKVDIQSKNDNFLFYTGTIWYVIRDNSSEFSKLQLYKNLDTNLFILL